MIVRSLLFFSIVFAVACQPQSRWSTPESIEDIVVEDSHKGDPLLDVLCFVGPRGEPVTSGMVLIGWALNDPFFGNYYAETNNSGCVLIPEGWQEALPVTIRADGYMQTTFYAQLPEPKLFQINGAHVWEPLEISGTTKDYQGVRKDGKIDFGLVLPVLKRDRFFFFNVTDVISPSMDYLEAYGQHAIPSNMAFPDQKENYSIFPVRINKPTYRIGVRAPGLHRVVAGHGRMPFKDTIKAIRDGASMFDLLNRIQFHSGGMAQVNVGSRGGKVDISMNQMEYAAGPSISAPRFASDKRMVAVTLHQNGNELIPADVKAFGSGEQKQLKSLVGYSNKSIFSVLGTTQKIDERVVNLKPQMSLTIAEGGSVSYKPQFLPLIEKPVVTGASLQAKAPQSVAGLNRVATIAILMDVKIEHTSSFYSETKKHKWEMYLQDWQEDIRLPQWPDREVLDEVNRWEVMYLGHSKERSDMAIGPCLLKEVTHATRNGVDL
jgi:hypothetical protein